MHSLKEGNWFKLICGASYQDLPSIRNLSLVYSLAGADCIDIAADPAVIAAVQEGIAVANQLQNTKENLAWRSPTGGAHPSIRLSGGRTFTRPWLMVSLNDGEDPHFRKAQFSFTQCPSDCHRPCESVCPAQAIEFSATYSGVIESRCYGCGRCLPICPEGLIEAHSHLVTPQEIIGFLESGQIDAIEIHTQVDRYENFRQLWDKLAPSVNQLKILAISCTQEAHVIDYLRSLYELISPLPCPLIWQTDGRSMSGDIGKGTTHEAITFGQRALQAKLPGYIQLAGGTNGYTITKLRAKGMLKQLGNRQSNSYVAGVAYGSYARHLLTPFLEQLATEQSIDNNTEQKSKNGNKSTFLKLENNPKLLLKAVNKASSLVNQIKTNVYQSQNY